MGRSKKLYDEAVNRADVDQARLDAERIDPRQAELEGPQAANGSGPAPAETKQKKRGEIRYSVYGTPRGQDAEEYIQSLPTITQVNKWLVASTGLVSKLYSSIRVVAEKTRLRANFGDRPLTEQQMVERIGYTPRTHKR